MICSRCGREGEASTCRVPGLDDRWGGVARGERLDECHGCFVAWFDRVLRVRALLDHLHGRRLEQLSLVAARVVEDEVTLARLEQLARVTA